MYVRLEPEEAAKAILKQNYDFISGLRLNCEAASEEYCLNKARELSILQCGVLINDSTSKQYWEFVKKLILTIEVAQ